MYGYFDSLTLIDPAATGIVLTAAPAGTAPNGASAAVSYPPSFGSVGTHSNTSSSTASIPVPAGVASGDIIVIPIFIDGGTVSITAMASGFTDAPSGPVSTGSTSPNHTLAVVWKRATGSDSGTYDFTLSGSTYRAGSAVRYTGCVPSGSPWDSGVDWEIDTVNDTDTAPVTITTTGADRRLIWCGTDWTGGTWTPPAGFTDQFDTGDHVNTLADMAAPTAGSYGPYTGLSGTTNRKIAFLGALLPNTGATGITLTAAPAGTTPAGATVTAATGTVLSAAPAGTQPGTSQSTLIGEPFFRTGTGTTALGSAGTCTVTIPAGVQSGDQMLITAVFKVATGTDTVQTPAGWTQLVAPVNGAGSSYQTAMFEKTAVVGSAGSTVTIAGGIPSSQQINAVFAAYVNADPTPRSSALATNGTTAATSVPVASATTAAGDLVVYTGGARESVNGPASEPTFTGPGTIRAQSAATSPSAQNVAAFIGDDGNTNGARTVTASQTSWSTAGQIVLKAATTTGVTLTVQPAGTQPGASAVNLPLGAVLAAGPAGTQPGGSPVTLVTGTALTATAAGTSPSGSGCTFVTGTVLTAQPAATQPGGATDTLAAGTVLAALTAGTSPSGAPSTVNTGTVLGGAAAGTSPGGSTCTFAVGTVLTAVPAGSIPAGAAATFTANSNTGLTALAAGTIISGGSVNLAQGLVVTAAPAGTQPSGGASTFTNGVPGTYTLTAAPAGTQPARAGSQYLTGTVLSGQPAATQTASGPATLSISITLTGAPAGTTPSGTMVTSPIGTALTGIPAATQPGGVGAVFASATILTAIPAIALPRGGPVDFTVRYALVPQPAGTSPAGSPVVFTGSTTTLRKPGILTAGSTRTAPSAGTTPYPRLTAGTLRGPAYTSGGGG